MKKNRNEDRTLRDSTEDIALRHQNKKGELTKLEAIHAHVLEDFLNLEFIFAALLGP